MKTNVPTRKKMIPGHHSAGSMFEQLDQLFLTMSVLVGRSIVVLVHSGFARIEDDDHWTHFLTLRANPTRLHTNFGSKLGSTRKNESGLFWPHYINRYI